MKSKILKYILSAILTVVLVFFATACANSNVDEERNTVKPDLAAAMQNYNDASIKRSKAVGKVVLTVYGKKTESSVMTHTVGQKVTLDRVLNNDMSYVEGRLESCDVTESFQNLVRGAASIINNVVTLNAKTLSAVDNVLAYINGQSYFTANLGYKAGTYNLKTHFHSGSSPTPTTNWVATDDASVNNFIKNNKVSYNVTLADYIMFNTFIDLSSNGKMIAIDNASKFFSSDTQSFYYNILCNNDEIYNWFFEQIANIAKMFSDEEYVEDIELYNKVLPYIKSWLSIGSTTVDATVNKDKYPTQLSTATKIMLDMPLADIEKVLGFFITDPDDKETIITLINTANATLIKDRKGTAGIISLDLSVSIEESFSYDEAACSLAGIDSDLFLPSTTEKEARYVFKETDNAAPPEDTLDGSNGIKTDNSNE